MRTLTTRPNSLLQGRQATYPVKMAGGGDTLWIPELERYDNEFAHIAHTHLSRFQDENSDHPG